MTHPVPASATTPLMVPATPLTVAAVQARPVPGDLAGNTRLAARLVERAADAGATLVVLPELFLPAYHPPTLRADPAGTDVVAAADGRIDDPRLDPLRAAARQRRAVVVVGAAVRHPAAVPGPASTGQPRRTCSSLVVDRAGTVRAAYHKQHLWGPDERGLFTAGERGATLLLDGWRLGLGVCYDGCFPEHARAAAADRAHGYLCPSGYLAGSEHRRDLYYAARALDNTMYVAFANSVGGESPWRFNGGAALYDPQGRPLARGADHGEEIVLGEFDPVELTRVRDRHRMLADRRDDLSRERDTFTA